MTCAVFDFATIAKHARLKALDGTPQNVVQPLSVGVDPGIVQPTEPQWFYGVAADGVTPVPMYYTAVPVTRGLVDRIASLVEGVNSEDLYWSDTAPSEWSAPDFDPA